MPTTAAPTLAMSTRFFSLGSAATFSPSLEYSGTRRLQWPHPAAAQRGRGAQGKPGVAPAVQAEGG